MLLKIILRCYEHEILVYFLSCDLVILETNLLFLTSSPGLVHLLILIFSHHQHFSVYLGNGSIDALFMKLINQSLEEKKLSLRKISTWYFSSLYSTLPHS